MNTTRFAALVRTMQAGITRRQGVRHLAGIGLLGTLSLTHGDPAASKKRKGKKKKRGQTPGTRCQEGQRVCQGACLGPSQCCTSAECPAGQVCTGGACGCAGGYPECPGDSGTFCCSPPPGVPVGRVTCGAVNGEVGCLCEVRAATACGTGCTSNATAFYDCTNLTGFLDAWCTDQGCPIP